MTNSDIADILKHYADLYELHDGNPFKVKQFASASFRVDKMGVTLFGKSIEELEKTEGLNKGLAAKIFEICNTGSFADLNDLLANTPEGVIQIMRIKGIGPKKVAHIWKELGIESIGELLYACKENRLAQAKGFGLKSQLNVIKEIEFIFASANKFHYAKLEPIANLLINDLQKHISGIKQISVSGDMRRRCEIIERIQITASVANRPEAIESISQQPLFSAVLPSERGLSGNYGGYPFDLLMFDDSEFAYQLFLNTATQEHLEQLGTLPQSIQNLNNENEIYTALCMQYIEPEMREGRGEVEKAKSHSLPKLIELIDLKGPLHNHSKWSDGLFTIEEMAKHCISKGYQYLGMGDHSKSAFYANGMKEFQIIEQHKEIDALNAKYPAFKIFKGIECDILYDGSMDYENDVLASFDYVVASVHSILKMTEEKAMQRLIGAIENPHTTILGHPTGRLLLMREGYPIDHKKMIDACVANRVVIEINANPYRLDLDWRWIDYALNKGAMLSINPDAHDLDGFADMYFGTLVARKGGLTKEHCLNAMNVDELTAYFSSK
ncbi:MAG: DNA polymerase/3'-5' exonuclease PolX [Bacteroidetes bacterium]|nr:DNA polymerase/3'-5' exonuclease PolX [Bacteroidota bacterium]